MTLQLRPELFGPFKTFAVHRASDDSMLSVTGWLLARTTAFGIPNSGAITASVVMTVERRVYIASDLPEGLDPPPKEPPPGWLGRLWEDGNSGFDSFEEAEQWAENWASEAVSQGGWFPLVFPLRCTMALARDCLERMARWTVLGAEVSKPRRRR